MSDPDPRAVTDPTFWKERLEFYKNPIESIIPNFHWEAIDPIHKKLIADYIRLDQSVIDIGCGPGRVSSWFSDDQYVGVDFSYEYLQEARRMNPNKKFDLLNIMENFSGNKIFDWGLLISVKGTLFTDEQWKEVEPRLKRYCKKLLILEYSRDYAEII